MDLSNKISIKHKWKELNQKQNNNKYDKELTKSLPLFENIIIDI